MKSSELKNKVLHYWRYNRRYSKICTEGGKFESDVLISNNKEIIECEIKTNKHDLVTLEWKKKKHSIYAKPNKWYINFIPNRFFIAVPKELVSFALEVVKDTKYGVLEVKEKGNMFRRNALCIIRKKAQLLTDKLNNKLLIQLEWRESSELIRTRMENARLREQVKLLKSKH